MPGVNKAIILGNLGKDPEVRTTSAGKPVVNFSVATSDTWKDKATGEKRERTEWHRIVIFNEHLCEIAQKYLKKGSKVYLEGAMQTRKWTAQDGVERYTTEIVLANFRGEIQLLSSGSGGPPPNTGEPDQPATGGETLDDEIPF
jgi:single-strand DNA-binding protein